MQTGFKNFDQGTARTNLPSAKNSRGCLSNWYTRTLPTKGIGVNAGQNIGQGLGAVAASSIKKQV